jgi:formylglycine-generating enzyme required for sulfatase activity
VLHRPPARPSLSARNRKGRATHARLWIAGAALTTLAGCGALLGINDLPVGSSDGGVDGATAEDGGPVAPDASGRDANANDASDGATVEPDAAADGGCVAEPLATTCAGKACGPAVDQCGNAVVCPNTCAGAVCGGNAATPNACSPPPSCEGGAVGTKTCGPAGNGTCCDSPLVTGGVFFRSVNNADPATVSDFRLDAYEVTVGRFRRFVNAVVGGYRPDPGSGVHAHLNGGKGLNGGTETGWDASWNQNLYKTLPEWNTALTTGSAAADYSWTSNDDRRPINAVSWYALHAFCIWDGGFLPTEAELGYAMTGGADQRAYAWGSTPPANNAALAAWNCWFNNATNTPSCTTGQCQNLAPVGSIPGGIGKYKQYDLTGNVIEWTLDGAELQGFPIAVPKPYPNPCVDCAVPPTSSAWVTRGGSYASGLGEISAYTRIANADARRIVGGRCARMP